MALSDAPIQEKTASELGVFPLVWIAWLDDLVTGLNREFAVSSPAETGDITLGLTNGTVLCDASGGAFTVTLPDVVEFTGVSWVIKKINTNSNDVTIDGDGVNIDLNPTILLTGANLMSRTIQSDGTQWWIS